jgi:xanthine/uracil/vitamin C permease (AzgA family)
MHRYFDFAGNGTSYRQETVAGIATFLTMAYIIIVNPAISLHLDSALRFRACGEVGLYPIKFIDLIFFY